MCARSCTLRRWTLREAHAVSGCACFAASWHMRTATQAQGLQGLQ